ncbi:hypothetical protein HMPREF1982_04293 [Clostridiales bacterium oral taxon 876 str. F0540]|nr:hypothetical protein HMPREF1982_04293 [Clostridiales bacterium oral taxon 876 str. F0540]
MEKVNDLKIHVNDYIIYMINQEDFKLKIKNLLIDEIKNIILFKSEDLIHADIYINIKSRIKKNIAEIIKTKNFKDGIYKFIDNNITVLENSNRTLDTIIPPAALNSLKVYIYNHKDDIISSLKDFLNSESIDKKIRLELNNVLNGINPMVSRFINTSNIYTKLKDSINSYLENPSNVMEVINMINSQIDTLTKKKISDFSSSFPTEGRKALITSITEGAIQNIFSNNFIDMSMNLIDDKLMFQLSNLKRNTDKLNNDLNNLVTTFMSSYYTSITASDSFKEIISIISNNLIDELLSKPLIELI